MLETRGVDIAVNWTEDIGDGGGSFFINSLVTFLDEFKIQDAARRADARRARYAEHDVLRCAVQVQAQQHVRLQLRRTAERARAERGVTCRRSASETAARNPATTQLGAEDYSVFGLFARYSINDRLELRGGIDNLFDEEPVIVEARPGVDSNTDVTRAEYYDILGRRAYIGIEDELLTVPSRVASDGGPSARRFFNADSRYSAGSVSQRRGVFGRRQLDLLGRHGFAAAAPATGASAVLIGHRREVLELRCGDRQEVAELADEPGHIVVVGRSGTAPRTSFPRTSGCARYRSSPGCSVLGSGIAAAADCCRSSRRG